MLQLVAEFVSKLGTSRSNSLSAPPGVRSQRVAAPREWISKAESLFSLCYPEAHIAGNRSNGGKSDPRGRLFAGTIAYAGSEKNAALRRIEPDLTYTKLGIAARGGGGGSIRREGRGEGLAGFEFAW